MKEEAIKKYQSLESKLSATMEALKAADEVIKQANELLMDHVWHDGVTPGEEDYSEALEKYQSLKGKL